MTPIRKGSKDSPFTHAPADWSTNGVPYGAWCKCCRCGLVHRSTISFDCYAKGPGEPLHCENCQRRMYGFPAAMSEDGRETFEGEVFKENP